MQQKSSYSILTQTAWCNSIPLAVVYADTEVGQISCDDRNMILIQLAGFINMTFFAQTQHKPNLKILWLPGQLYLL